MTATSPEKDRFSSIAADYANYRPTYPQSLYESLLKHVSGRDMALDCGTGSGQAAAALAPYFKDVYATDISAAQMSNAIQRQNIYYRLMPGHEAPVEVRDGAADLIVSAQAMHWFDRPAFFAMAEQKLKPGGVLAIWAYGNHKTDDPTINATIEDLNTRVLGAYWDAEVQALLPQYDAMHLPMTPLELPPMIMQSEWDLSQLLGYFKSWSASKKYIDRNGDEAFNEALKPIVMAWGSPSITRVFTVQNRLKASQK